MKIIYKKILLAVDGSLHSNNAVHKAIELQKIWNCEVLIIHSIKDNRSPSDLYPNVQVLYSTYSTLDEVYKEAGNTLLNKTKRKFGASQDMVETRLIEKIAPEDYITKIVEKENIDLVVLGSRGQHSKIKKVSDEKKDLYYAAQKNIAQNYITEENDELAVRTLAG
ncbi:MAG: universal stress protein, partial [Promethearchaeota archaeon]